MKISALSLLFIPVFSACSDSGPLPDGSTDQQYKSYYLSHADKAKEKSAECESLKKQYKAKKKHTELAVLEKNPNCRGAIMAVNEIEREIARQIEQEKIALEKQKYEALVDKLYKTPLKKRAEIYSEYMKNRDKDMTGDEKMEIQALIDVHRRIRDEVIDKGVLPSEDTQKICHDLNVNTDAFSMGPVFPGECSALERLRDEMNRKKRKQAREAELKRQQEARKKAAEQRKAASQRLLNMSPAERYAIQQKCDKSRQFPKKGDCAILDYDFNSKIAARAKKRMKTDKQYFADTMKSCQELAVSLMKKKGMSMQKIKKSPDYSVGYDVGRYGECRAAIQVTKGDNADLDFSRYMKF